MLKRTATCACGKLSVTCVGDPIRISVCHCLDCQKRTGSTYGVGAFFARNDVEAKGDFRTYRRSSDSGSAVTFHFCPDCGSTVFWKAERLPNAVAVAVGSFADPTFPAPSQSVYNERRHPWVPSVA
ncbi:MAG TPA: GFA family protein [Bradyrhizobium sp.]|uniref:GFA family protein n=1 Tax=Bradyrhizobium sp. TaxID=376 RepID=UPI002C58E005|nr:GFA family protein [Bradyrhizobium sp.]HLZ00530.1 GFA family protein [Bradyrhizobium sp.]